MSLYPLKPLENVLQPVRREVVLEPDETYLNAGIYSFGRGLFPKQPLTGADTRYRSMFRLTAGDFVYSRLFGWEGAVAVVTPEFDGYLVSQEFPTFEIDESQASFSYVTAICRWAGFHEMLAKRTKGLGLRRHRVHPEQLLSIQVPLPDLKEQLRVGAKVDRILGSAASLISELDRARVLARATLEAALESILAVGVGNGWHVRPIGSVAEVNPKPKGLDPNESVTFVPMSAVDDVTGSIAVAEERLVIELKSRYRQFCRGDVIFARITPCMQNGKSAVVDGIPTEFGFGSTEFHVIRPGEEVLPEWIHRIVRTRHFREKAAERFTGTAGQQRVPADFIKSAEIPVPQTIEEQKEALIRIDSILEQHLYRRQLHLAQVARARALTPSVLNRAFNGDL